VSQADVDVVTEFFRTWANRDYRDEASWDAVNEVLEPDFDYREDPDWPGAWTWRRSSTPAIAWWPSSAFGRAR
jgi:GH35 family endo-1,4-beta-xylanase